MSQHRTDSFSAVRWNACIDLLAQPLETLNAIQRPAAMAFRYYGRIMNGGHSLHFDYHEDELDQELLSSLQRIGALEHAAIFAEVLRRRREIHPATQEEQDAESEFIERHLDAQFDRLRPDMVELLQNYIEKNWEEFPTS